MLKSDNVHTLSFHLPSVDTVLKNAQILIAHGEYVLARELLKQAHFVEPSNFRIFHLWGDSYWLEKQFEEALFYYQKCIYLHEDGDIHFKLARTYSALGQEDESCNHWYVGLQWPGHKTNELFEAYKDLGNHALRHGDVDEAEEYYNRAFAINPQSDVLLTNYGSLDIQRGEWGKAFQRFQTALKINKKCEKAWIGLALTYQFNGEIQQAWNCLGHALEIDPQQEIALELIQDWWKKQTYPITPSKTKDQVEVVHG